MKTHYYIAAITCTSHFPIDMLRHEQCWPVTERDAANIENSYTYGQQVEEPIYVIRSNSFRDGWTEKRWESFGVKLQNVARCYYYAGAVAQMEEYIRSMK